MPKIVITEVDNTSPGVLSESTDVVYIPGFVNLCIYSAKASRKSEADKKSGWIY